MRLRPRSLTSRRSFLLGAFLFLVALGPGEEPRGDPASRHLVTAQILSEGTLHLPEPHPEWALVRTPQGWTSYFGIGQTLLFVPFELAGSALSALLPEELAGSARSFPLNFLYRAVVGVAFLIVLIRLFERLGLSAREAEFASMIFTFSTIAAHYVVQSYQEEAIAAVFVGLSLYAALQWQRDGRDTQAFVLGLCVATLLLFRINAVFVFIPVAVLVAPGLLRSGLSGRTLRTAAAAAAGAAAPAAIHAIFAYLRFGDPFSTGYGGLEERVIFPPLPLQLWQPFSPAAAFSLLFGLGKGLFVYSPLLAIALWGMWVDRGQRGALWLGSLAALAGNVVLCAFFVTPDGCWSWGSRYQVHLLPLFAYPAWVGSRDLFVRRRWRPLPILAIGLGVVFQACALVAPDGLEYTQLQIRGSENSASCRIVQDEQFPRRLKNIASVITHVTGTGDISGLSDPYLEGTIGHVWVLRVARPNGWRVRTTALAVWLTVLAVALMCFRGAWAGSLTEQWRVAGGNET